MFLSYIFVIHELASANFIGYIDSISAQKF